MKKKSDDLITLLIAGILSGIVYMIKSFVNFLNQPKKSCIAYSEQQEAEYNIMGMNYRDFKHKLRSNFFVGYVKTEDNNDYDPSAIAVFNENDLHLGYIPYGNAELFNKLNTDHEGSFYCFGFVKYDKNDKEWFGKVVIPVGMTRYEIKKYRDTFLDNYKYIFKTN